MNISEYLTSQRVESGDMYSRAKRIKCADGFSISVQANPAVCCSPRDNNGPWHRVECGYPSAVPELILGYAEHPDQPTHTVYGYVPVELVEQLIELHGGQK